MRVNPNQWGTLLSHLDTVTAAENEALEQVSTGRRINQASDDPAAMAMWIENKAQQSECDQYSQNISMLTGSLQAADSALSSVVTALTRAVSLGVEADNGIVSASNRGSIANEISGIRDQVLSLANSTFNGSYIFAGSATDAQPFVTASNAAGVTYSGDSVVRQVPVADGSTAAAGAAGDSIFLASTNNVFAALSGLITAIQAGTGIDTATGSLRDALDHVSAARVQYGTDLQQLSTQSGLQSNTKLQLQTQENSLSSVDMAEAIGRLTNAENARSASLAAISRIGQTSLLDYLGASST